MAKTYNTFTNVSTGDVLTATNFNNVLTNVGNYRVPPICSVYRNAALSQTSSGNYQAVSFDTEHFTNTGTGDSPTDPMWQSGTNPTRITFRTTGIYQVTGSATFNGNATGLRAIRINRNGSSAAYGTLVPANSVINYLTVSAIIEATAVTDYVELAVYQDTGGNLAYQVGSDVMRFSAVWVGQKS